MSELTNKSDANKNICHKIEIKIPKRPSRPSGREDYTFALEGENVYIADALKKVFDFDFNTLFREQLSAQFRPEVEIKDDEVCVKLSISKTQNEFIQKPEKIQTNLNYDNFDQQKETVVEESISTYDTNTKNKHDISSIEPDMQIYPCKIGNDENGIINLIFASNPIIGNSLELIIFKSIINSTKEILKQALENKDLTFIERSKLTLAIIYFAFDWKKDNKEDVEELDENEETGFWNYIARCFEMEYSQNFYQAVTRNIYNSMQMYKRLFVTENSEKRYVSTVLLHALAPQYNLFNFFNFIYDNQDILTNKSEIRTLIEPLKEPYNANKYHIKQGIQKLIKHRPQFAYSFIEEILAKINDLFDGEVVQNSSRVDFLLGKWFEDEIYLKRGKNSREFSDSIEKIKPKYILKDYEIYLTIPDCQMKEKNNSYSLKTYLDDILQDEQELFLYKDNILAGTEINLLSFLHTDSCSLNLKIEILSDDKMIFNSEKRLFREHILFKSGKECSLKTVKSGNGYTLLCPDSKADYNFKNCDYEFENYTFGKLFYLTLDEGFMITKNGKIICSDTLTSKILVTPDRPCNEYAVFHKDGKDYKIFKNNFSLLVKNIASDPRSIVVTINNDFNLLSKYGYNLDNEDNEIYKIDIPDKERIADYDIDQDTESGIYNISISTLDDEEVFTDKFCIIQNFDIEFDKPYYIENILCGNVTIYSDNFLEEILIDDNIDVEYPYNGGNIKVYLPIVKWKITDNGKIVEPHETKNATLVWHKAISQHAILTVTHPKTASSSIKISNRLKKGNQKSLLGSKYLSTDFDLGNILKSGTDKIDLCIFGKSIKTFYLRETFKSSPKFKIDGQKLYIENPEDFINKSHDPILLYYKFILIGKKDISFKFERLSNEKNLVENVKIPSGLYKYEISIDDEEDEIFGESQRCVCQGECNLKSSWKQNTLPPPIIQKKSQNTTLNSKHIKKKDNKSPKDQPMKS